MRDDIVQLNARIAELEQENMILRQQHYEIGQAKELYLKIFEEFPALIWRSGLDKACNYFNKTWLDFTGRTMAQEMGNGWAEGVHPDDFDFCLNIYVSAFDRREAFLMEYRLKNREGEYRWIRDFGRPFYDLDNTFLGYIGSCYDITENKNYELQLQSLNATKDKLFSIIAHDLRNPFHSILGFTKLLEEKLLHGGDTAQLKEVAGGLHAITKTTFDLLENLLEWSQAQTNKIASNPKKIDFITLCAGVVQTQEDVARKKGVELLCFTAEPTTVLADENMVKTILRNLISNAIKFSSPQGQVHLFAEKKGAEAIINVVDNGVGIDPSMIDSLFDLKVKTSTKGTAGEPGTGIGLPLCKEFVEKLGGRIWVESTPGKGSTFSFSLPLATIAG